MEQKIIAVTGSKGGIGKTTVSLNLARGLTKKGYKVLVVDLDQQASLGEGVGIFNPTPQLGNVLQGQATWLQTVKTVYDMDIMPSSSDLKICEHMLNADVKGSIRLRQLLEINASEYQIIILDCPINETIFTRMALVAATHYIVPIQPEKFPFLGLDKIRIFISDIRDMYNPNLEMLGVLRSIFDKKTIVGRQINQQLSEMNEIPVFNTIIRKSQSVIESQFANMPVIDYSPTSKAALDFISLSDEVSNKLFNSTK